MYVTRTSEKDLIRNVYRPTLHERLQDVLFWCLSDVHLLRCFRRPEHVLMSSIFERPFWVYQRTKNRRTGDVGVWTSIIIIEMDVQKTPMNGCPLLYVARTFDKDLIRTYMVVDRLDFYGRPQDVLFFSQLGVYFYDVPNVLRTTIFGRLFWAY